MHCKNALSESKTLLRISLRKGEGGCPGPTCKSPPPPIPLALTPTFGSQLFVSLKPGVPHTSTNVCSPNEAERAQHICWSILIHTA